MESSGTPTVDPTMRSHVAVVDGIRGYTIALVLLYHFWPGWVHPAALTISARASWITVDLFFLISGFSIFYPCARSIVDGKPKGRLQSFALRRFAKIYPSYALSLLGLTVLGWSMTGYHDIGFQLFTHAIFIHSFFDETILGINGPVWSLALEIQFYVLFAATRNLAMRAPLAYAAVLIGIGFCYRLVVATVTHSHTNLLSQQLPSVLDLFGGGILIAYGYRFVLAHRPSIAQARITWTILSTTCFIGLYLLLFAIERVVNIPTAPHVLAALVRTAEMPLFFGLAAGALFSVDALRGIIANRASVYLAAISYNLYLWHQGIFLALMRLVGSRAAGSSLVHAGVAVVAVIASVGVAHVLTYYFERPIRVRLQSVEGRRASAA